MHHKRIFQRNKLEEKKRQVNIEHKYLKKIGGEKNEQMQTMKLKI